MGNSRYKFRAWDKVFKRMLVAGDSNLPDLTANGCPIEPHTRKNLSMEMELMQFTGLLDKSGKEIYEGDICKISSCDDDGNWQKETDVTEIKYYDGCFKTTYYGFPVSSWAKNNNVHIEVIGNVHEHPELLTP